MPATVSLKRLVEDAQNVSFTTHAFLCRKSGEVVFIEEDELQAADREIPEGSPEWFAEAVAVAREILDCEDYVALPFAHLDHYGTMRAFCEELEDDRQRGDLLAKIRGRGAFRRFKDGIVHHDLEDAWSGHRNRAIAAEVRAWLDREGIAYEEDLAG